jgi:serine/threonine protein kinase
MSEQDVLTIGTIIDDRYRLISEGTTQGLGMAYKAHDLKSDQLANLVVVATQWGSGQEALGRLQSVELTVASLAAPSLIPYEQTGLVNGQVYLVYPQAEGQTVAELLARYVRINAETAVDITIGLCEALAAAHRAGLTHGGLSPDCVVIEEGTADDSTAAKVLVLDTGLFPALRPADPLGHKAWGRLPYISPEQASGKGVQPSSDVYVIGAILYEMLIGRPPFRAEDEEVLVLQHLHQEPPSLQIMDTSISKRLAQIVYKTLAKEPSSRYRNASQLGHVLRTQVAPQPEPVEPVHTVQQPTQVQPVQPLAAAQLIRQGHLVVPPPPAPVTGDAWSPTGLYDLEGSRDWKQKAKQDSVDWVLIALLIAALIAVLGLVPLWRAVYSRYVTGPTSSYPAPHRLETALAPALEDDDFQGYQTQSRPRRAPRRGAELDESVVVWYNTIPSGPSLLAHLHPINPHARHPSERREKNSGFWSPAYG